MYKCELYQAEPGTSEEELPEALTDNKIKTEIKDKVTLRVFVLFKVLSVESESFEIRMDMVCCHCKH